MRTGRPSKLDENTKRILLANVQIGMSYVDACCLAGISYKTFYMWSTRGDKARKIGITNQYTQFLDELDKSRITGKQANLLKIKKATEHDWKAAQWLLSVQYPDEFSQSRPRKEPQDAENESVSLDELQQLLDAMKREND